MDGNNLTIASQLESGREIAPTASILVVDDEVALMKALCNTLQDFGYRCVGYNSPLEALEAVRTEEFDLVLSDLMMPEIDGIAFIQRALELDQNLVCVIMTGQGTVATAVDAMKSGAVDYILKPFKVNDALPVISRALEIRQLRIDKQMLQAQLQQNFVELEARNEELKLFSAAASHDLRAPLNRIGGFAYILQETCGHLMDADSMESLKFIQSSVEDMRRLISGLLDLTMVRETELQAEEVDLSTMAHLVGKAALGATTGRRVSFDVEPGLYVIADDRLMSIVLTNLIGNAVKFTAKTDPAVISFGREPSDDRQPYFVRDNGAGFDQIHADKLFTPFKRLHSDKEFAGSGIGLSTVQRIIRRHGGQIWSESEPGNGATFFFTIGDIR
ncbi:MAG: response regulator [Armatimonadetes bacterium]|nr:response regulator [Armatimonadota bacterium]MBS1702255.1 response regulator [Armatimonadota bacterium]MBS1727087.1 response regulator [Armatimonadota bacterium]